MLEFFIPSMPCLIGGRIHTERKVKQKEPEEANQKSKDTGEYAKVDMSEAE